MVASTSEKAFNPLIPTLPSTPWDRQMSMLSYVDVGNWGLSKWCFALFVAFILSYDVYLVTRYKLLAWRNGGGKIPVQANWPLGLPPVVRMVKASNNNRSLEDHMAELKEPGSPTFAMELTMTLNIYTRDPENVKSMLATDFKSFGLGRRDDQLGAFLGSGIFTLAGSGWKHSRIMLRPQFSREQVAQLESLNGHVNNLIARLDETPGEFVDAQDLFHKLTMDATTDFLFGESTESLSDKQCEVNGVTATQFIQDYNTALDWCLLRFFLGKLYWLANPKQFQNAVARSRRFVEHFVDKALEATDKDSTTTGYTFTHELAKVTRDRILIRDQAFNLLLAGRDTTASLLAYTLWYLGKYPKVFARLRREVLSQFGTDVSTITFETLKRCDYLRHIVNEVLRVSPVVPRNSRTATQDTFLPRGGGPDGTERVFIPKGTEVLYSVYDIHHNPLYWGPDADEFKPERWESVQGKGWEYLPFNGGPRICLGQQFALTETSYTILRLAQEYDRIELRDPDADLVNFVRLTACVAGGVNVIMHRPSS